MEDYSMVYDRILERLKENGKEDLAERIGFEVTRSVPDQKADNENKCGLSLEGLLKKVELQKKNGLGVELMLYIKAINDDNEPVYSLRLIAPDNAPAKDVFEMGRQMNRMGYLVANCIKASERLIQKQGVAESIGDYLNMEDTIQEYSKEIRKNVMMLENWHKKLICKCDYKSEKGIEARRLFKQKCADALKNIPLNIESMGQLETIKNHLVKNYISGSRSELDPEITKGCSMDVVREYSKMSECYDVNTEMFLGKIIGAHNKLVKIFPRYLATKQELMATYDNCRIDR
jgi:hypothetical protein